MPAVFDQRFDRPENTLLNRLQWLSSIKEEKGYSEILYGHYMCDSTNYTIQLENRSETVHRIYCNTLQVELTSQVSLYDMLGV